MGSAVAAFDGAADLLVAVVDEIPDSAWHQPGLGSWTVLELVAHAHRGLTTVEDYLLRPVEQVSDVGAYASPEAVATRARQAVAVLGDAPARTLRETRGRVVALVAATPLDASVGTPFGAVTLAAYLPTRTAELTVHSVDLADALGITVAVAYEPLRETLDLLVTRALQQDKGADVIRGLSGRAPLPAGFSVF